MSNWCRLFYVQKLRIEKFVIWRFKLKIILSLLVIFFIQNFALMNNESIKENSIIGSWTNCVTQSGDHSYYANVCKIFIFKSDNKGYVVLPQNDSNYFTWNIKNDTLILSNLTGYDFFENDTIFKLIYSDNNTEIALNSCIYDKSYTLLRNTK